VGVKVGAKPWDRGSRGWWIRIYTDGKKVPRKVGPPGEVGEAKAIAVCKNLNERNEQQAIWSASPLEPLPVARLVESWRTTHAPLLTRRTRATNRARSQRLIDSAIGQKDVRDLNIVDCQAFAATILKENRNQKKGATSPPKKLSGSLASGCLSILRRVVNLAVESKLIDSNPVPGLGKLITSLAKTVGSTDAWTLEEATHIRELAKQHGPRGLYVALCIAFATGARRGEILALEWERIDFSRRQIHYWQAMELGGGTKDPKSKADRYTPMTNGLAELLKEEYERQRRDTLKGKGQPKWVILSPEGLFWFERNFSRSYERLQRRFGTEARQLKFHSTRHSFITWALTAGRSPKKVSKWVGATTQVIHNTYEHALPDSEDSMEFAELGTPHDQLLSRRHEAVI
jgi:integrase